MAISTNTGFLIGSKAPIDERLVFATIADMKAYDTNLIPDVYFAVNKEDGQLYIYNVDNDEDPKTGKWKVLEGGEGEGMTALTKAEYDALTEEEKKDKYFFITDGASPEEVTGLISADEGNKLTTGTDDGLFVPDMTAKVSAEANNQLQSKDDGLFVPDMTTKVSSEADNRLTTKDDGLFVPDMTTKVSSETNNQLQSKDDGLYVADMTTKVSTEANNQLVTKDDGLYVPKTTVTSTYSSTGTDAVNGKAVASAVSGKANTTDLGTQVTYRLDGTTLYITTK